MFRLRPDILGKNRRGVPGRRSMANVSRGGGRARFTPPANFGDVSSPRTISILKQEGFSNTQIRKMGPGFADDLTILSEINMKGSRGPLPRGIPNTRRPGPIGVDAISPRAQGDSYRYLKGMPGPQPNLDVATRRASRATTRRAMPSFTARKAGRIGGTAKVGGKIMSGLHTGNITKNPFRFTKFNKNMMWAAAGVAIGGLVLKTITSKRQRQTSNPYNSAIRNQMRFVR